jgi:alkylation response protein AidB-like acyl-CoA dehydrogenase
MTETREAFRAVGGSLTKLLYSEHARRTADDAMRLLGAVGLTSEHPDAAPWAERLLFAPGLRLGGGTDEIQRNTIAERGLGLPRDISAAPGQSSEAHSVRSKA